VLDPSVAGSIRLVGLDVDGVLTDGSVYIGRVGAQAVEFLAPLEPGAGVRAAHAFVRTLSERLREDRPLSADIERVAAAIRDGQLGTAVAAAVGEPV